jgi:serine/threonine protein kinase
MGTSFRHGDLIDHYRLDSLVGKGGMACLFRATDTRTGQSVALKIPHSDQPLRSAFAVAIKSETRIARKLNHPGVPRMLSPESSSRLYAVMEWVSGRSLRQILDEQRVLPIERSVEIAIKVCEVLEYIHRQGIVHLDLKPGNIIVGTGNEVKLIDFGIAREMQRGLWSLLAPKVKGTPDYASPEQIRGKTSDGRSDIYSLGLVLYEMLTGEVPFSGVSSAAALRLRVSIDPPSPDEINPNIAPELCDAVCRAIARDPVSRPASARELSYLLERIECSALPELVGSV